MAGEAGYGKFVENAGSSYDIMAMICHNVLTVEHYNVNMSHIEWLAYVRKRWNLKFPKELSELLFICPRTCTLNCE